jgi:peptide/nickel transport system permease protein
VLPYIFKRTVSMIISLLVASIIIFVIVQILPGDVAQMILGQYQTPETLHQLRESLGLYDSFYVRYIRWISGVLRGDLGISLSITGCRIADLLLDRSRNSLFLAACASLLVIPLSLLIGTVAGLKRDTWIDKVVSLTTMVAISLPEFASGIFFILVFSLTFKLLPAMSNIDTNVQLLRQFPMLILPILTLSLVILGYIARMTRASVIEVSSSNYVRTAILTGLPISNIILKHILRNALLPSITVIAMNMGWLIGGIIVVESVFAFPGLGSLLLYGVMQRDVPLIQATVLFAVAAYMIFNFIADLLYLLLNPRLRNP